MRRCSTGTGWGYSVLMPFWKKRKPEFEPESLRMSRDQLEATAAEAVEGFFNAFKAEGYDLTDIKAIEGGRGFERAVAVMMNLGGSQYYRDSGLKLAGAGVRDPEYYKVIAENAKAVNSLVLRKLAALECDVKRLQESEQGVAMTPIDPSPLVI